MSDKTVFQLDELGSSDFGQDDLLLVWDSVSGTTRKASIETVATVSGTKGGFTFTGGFANRNYIEEQDNRLVIDTADINKWIPLDLSSAAQQATDAPWWPGSQLSTIDLFGGSALPYGVTRMLDFTQTWNWSSYTDTATTNYGGASRVGTLKFDQLDTGTTNIIRIDMNITPMIANTTVEVGLWFQPRKDEGGPEPVNDGSAFPLPGSPLFFGTGTVGRTFLSRPTSTMYIASSSDQLALALPAIKSDNPIIVEPLSLLAQNLR